MQPGKSRLELGPDAAPEPIPKSRLASLSFPLGSQGNLSRIPTCLHLFVVSHPLVALDFCWILSPLWSWMILQPHLALLDSLGCTQFLAPLKLFAFAPAGSILEPSHCQQPGCFYSPSHLGLSFTSWTPKLESGPLCCAPRAASVSYLHFLPLCFLFTTSTYN